jgi:hypothetical protein
MSRKHQVGARHRRRPHRRRSGIVLYPKLVVTLPKDGAAGETEHVQGYLRGPLHRDVPHRRQRDHQGSGGKCLQHLGPEWQRHHPRLFTGGDCSTRSTSRRLRSSTTCSPRVQERCPTLDAGLDRSRNGQGTGLRRHEGTLGELAGFEEASVRNPVRPITGTSPSPATPSFGFNKGTRISVLDDPARQPMGHEVVQPHHLPGSELRRDRHPRQPPEASVGLEVPVSGARAGPDPHP